MNYRGHLGPITITESGPIEMTPERIAEKERDERNRDCLRIHSREIYETHRGKYVYFAGGEYFVGDTVKTAIAAAAAKHPDDPGGYLLHIPLERLMRI
jgi:hypothetical protein